MPRKTAGLALLVLSFWTLTATAGAAPGDYAGPPPVGAPPAPTPPPGTDLPTPPPSSYTGVVPPPGVPGPVVPGAEVPGPEVPGVVPVSTYTGVGPSYVGTFPPSAATVGASAFPAIDGPQSTSPAPGALAGADQGGVSRFPVTRGDVVGLSIVGALVLGSLVSLRRRAS